ncbi:hypothetical protein BJY21_003013 [Kineosphaera limosa]|uniref:PknH-like extracellular domain-containing protein n=1 Tax=Kineosphaera limosa NBRC 100340 TaxID=1184609 RepID=K6WXB8_9MICO|nr:hypothetical protein [Kineosphaera limosa]NYE01829.1 hypothetical protein [Kineosphaera limosa]GAB96732.1 hypothetical protein KILIM_046_00160 [Kineosphaera limosa NBRC 100340]
MTWSPTQRRLLAAVAAPAGALLLASCSALGLQAPVATPGVTTPLGAPTVETLEPQTPTQIPSPTGAGGQQSAGTMPGGNGMAQVLVLGDEAVPPGWVDATPRETGGYRMSVCGVDLEPTSPLDGAQRRWQLSANGRFLEQHVRVYTGGTAAAVVANLQRAIPSCTSYTTRDGGGTATYRVERLRVAGAGADIVAWRQKLTLPRAVPQSTQAPTAPASPTSPTALPTAAATTAAAPTTAVEPAQSHELIQDVAVTRRGSSVVLLASYSIDQAPQADVLATAVKALGPQR